MTEQRSLEKHTEGRGAREQEYWERHPICDDGQAYRLVKAIGDYGTRKKLAGDMTEHGRKVSPQRISQLVKNPFSITDSMLRSIADETSQQGHDYDWILFGITHEELDAMDRECMLADRELGYALARGDYDAGEYIATAFCALGLADQCTVATVVCNLLRHEMDVRSTIAENDPYRGNWERLLVESARMHRAGERGPLFGTVGWDQLEWNNEPHGFEEENFGVNWIDTEENRIKSACCNYAESIYRDILAALGPYRMTDSYVPASAHSVEKVEN